MWSSSPACARPVRTLPRSAFSASSDLCILCSAFFLTSAKVFTASPVPAASGVDVHQRAFALAGDDQLHGARLQDAENGNRKFLVAAQAERRGVHHPED